MTVPGPSAAEGRADLQFTHSHEGEQPRHLLPEPPMPADLLAYEDGPDPMTVGDRLMALAVLGPWAWAVVGWSWGVMAHELVKVVRGR